MFYYILTITTVLSFLTSCTNIEKIVRNMDDEGGSISSKNNTFFEKIIIVRQGDNIYKIAKRHKTTLRDIILKNNLKPPYEIFVGQKLKFTTLKYHIIIPGDTIFSLSRRYGVAMRTLVAMNSLRPPYQVRPGDKIKIPGQTERHTSSTANNTIRKSRDFISFPIPREKPVFEVKLKKTKKIVSRTRSALTKQPLAIPPARTSSRFLWPTRGRIISNFGPRLGGLHNDGINIAAPKGSPVFAAENGVVAYAGNGLRGFGNLILIKHAEGWTTAYAHIENILVKRGTNVKRGEKIGTIGNTGGVSRPQLHFEVRKGAQAVDPRIELTI